VGRTIKVDLLDGTSVKGEVLSATQEDVTIQHEAKKKPKKTDNNETPAN
jgi:hypothetical protein